MNNGKILVTAVAAGMLAVPASHAAIDDAGMQYTSAAEGFYGSLRMAFTTSATKAGATKDRLSGVDASVSRLGVRGTVDLGGGMSASYNYEFGVNGDNGPQIEDDASKDDGIGNTRLHNVDLSGGFGSLLVGTQWALDYNYVWGNTDVMNVNSGFFAYNANRAGRQSNAVTYTSPDFNGFSFGISAVMSSASEQDSLDASGLALLEAALDDEGGSIGDVAEAIDLDLRIEDGADVDDIDRFEALPDPVLPSGDGDEGATIDKTVLAAGYSIRGFNIAGTYVRRDIPRYLVRAFVGADNGGADDELSVGIVSDNPTSIGLRLGYGQDNWSLNYVYGKTDHDSRLNLEEEHHSVAGQLQVGKTTLRALYETQEASLSGSGFSGDADIDHYTLSAQYDLGSKSRIWTEYSGSDSEISGVDSTTFNVGYRVDF
jgi:predicted porin